MPYESFTAGEKLTAAKLNERLVGWCKYNQLTGPGIADSYNVDSVDDDATGQFTVNWTTPFAGASQYVAGGVATNTRTLSVLTFAADSTQFRTDYDLTDQDRDGTAVHALGDRT